MSADAGDDVGEPRLWLNAVHASGANQRIERGSANAARIRSAEEPVLSAQSRRADFVFRSIIRDLEPAIVEVARERVPSPAGIADGFGEIALAGDFGELRVESDGQIIDFGFAVRWRSARADLGP